MTREEALRFLESNTHAVFGEETVNEVAEALGVELESRTYHPDPPGTFKGLTTHDGKPIKGLAVKDMALLLCHKLGVDYASKMGRGFQVRACTTALREYFKEKEEV